MLALRFTIVPSYRVELLLLSLVVSRCSCGRPQAARFGLITRTAAAEGQNKAFVPVDKVIDSETEGSDEVFGQEPKHHQLLDEAQASEVARRPSRNLTDFALLELASGSSGQRSEEAVGSTKTRVLAGVAFIIIFCGCLAVSVSADSFAVGAFSSGYTIFIIETVHKETRSMALIGRFVGPSAVLTLVTLFIRMTYGWEPAKAVDVDGDGDYDEEDAAQEAALYEAGGYEYYRFEVYKFTEVPESSRWAFSWAIFVMAVSVYSCGYYAISTMQFMNPDINPQWQRVDRINECVTAVFFTFEYCLRLWSARSRNHFLSGVMNAVDFCVFAPFWLSLDAGTNFLRVLRIFKMFRLMKMAGFIDTLMLLVRAMHNSINGLLLLIMFLFVGSFLIASLVWEVDGKDWDPKQHCWIYHDPLPDWANSGKPTNECMPYQSVPDALYYAITTMTTVGYGDITPGTKNGRIVGCLGMVMGVLVIAMPVSVLSSEFMTVYQDVMQDRDVQKGKKGGSEAGELLFKFEEAGKAMEELFGEARIHLERHANLHPGPNANLLAKVFRNTCGLATTQTKDRLNHISDLLKEIPKADKQIAEEEEAARAAAAAST